MNAAHTAEIEATGLGINALTRNATGDLVVPTSDEHWDLWVSASATRNHVLDNPLLDWLERHGEVKGYGRDSEALDPRTDFLTFIFAKGTAFEQAVVRHLSTLADVHVPEGAERGYEARRDLAVAEATFDAMRRGLPVIYQGVLRDAEARTYGAPDLLVRADVLHGLFPRNVTAAAATVEAPDLPGLGTHYRVVDTKFTQLQLAAGGELGNSGSAAAYKVQLHIYNRMLARLQGCTAPESFVLGRGWEQTRRGVTTRVHNCMDRLGSVAKDYASLSGGRLEDQANAAISWIRRVRTEGHEWLPAPEPGVDELRVNAKADSAPWSNAVAQILAKTEDLTQLYWVGVEKRRQANRAGITRWTDPAVTPASVGVGGGTMAPRLQALLDVNRDHDGAPLRPTRVQASRDEWITPPPVEFFVDFETVSSLDDDFAKIPERGGQELIFMIGCGHIEDGEWRFQCFITPDLGEPEEARIIDEWIAHMHEVRDRLAPGMDPRVIHWSPAEETWLETAWYAAVKRHPEKNWPHPNWFDFLTRVVQQEPVVVRGAHGFGLKAVTKAMHALDLIDIDWDDGPTDGLGAMVGAWWCAHEAKRLGVLMFDLELMRQIRAYNEVDCRAMMEIIRLLRVRH